MCQIVEDIVSMSSTIWQILMDAVQDSRAAAKARRSQEKIEWEKVIKAFPIDKKKKDEALELLKAQPL